MKLDGVRESGNVEDRRGNGGKIVLGGGGVIVVILLSLLTGKSPTEVTREINRAQPQQQHQQPRANAGTDRAKQFVSRVLATTEDAWAEQFNRMRRRYQQPTLVLFTDEVESACGYADAAVGPFYCPRDRKAYLDLTFFAELSSRFGSPGDFAQAYVVAHEIGHHVQKLLGTSDAVAHAGGKENGATGTSVRVELQADCYAGVWGAYAKRHGLLDMGDVDEAMRAAQAIGDDTLQRRARGRVQPETFTHGTSAQRARWFKRGMQRGEPSDCDTFRAKDL